MKRYEADRVFDKTEMGKNGNFMNTLVTHVQIAKINFFSLKNLFVIMNWI